MSDKGLDRERGRTAPADNPEDFGSFMGQVSARYRGWIDAYEIWNEPNLHYEWGDQRPDPTRFAALMKAVCPKVRAANPDATVIVGAPARTGDRDEQTVLGDPLFIQRLYDAGVRDDFDALGSHPYAASNPPDAPSSESGLELNRTREQREVLVWNGDDKPLRATEFGTTDTLAAT